MAYLGEGHWDMSPLAVPVGALDGQMPEAPSFNEGADNHLRLLRPHLGAVVKTLEV